ncbi:hypothetical protein SERLA73DRAFT_73918 [Serpula lacrymans var. lacrymans S7.3]|uniref:Uncharacterized protein n=2 Tax=Serpula lacrymans var. lacrymans TaxID=341189 RepID=F8PXB5_SERL3|nr:uncharacterized protein SERLADRAFT_438550 [Serpula lacrymans var. lacrymans S7.9]EGN99390.1 hypothetical protein SERLA73DRAFT_73918 [Serpula lacrymans var. lacrymans S7.3]EGO24951.1 hypothetical protein SERLADRAFT_438550 [Serpula lacrymans var. lacrymans S7.9]
MSIVRVRHESPVGVEGHHLVEHDPKCWRRGQDVIMTMTSVGLLYGGRRSGQREFFVGKGTSLAYWVYKTKDPLFTVSSRALAMWPPAPVALRPIFVQASHLGSLFVRIVVAGSAKREEEDDRAICGNIWTTVTVASKLQPYRDHYISVLNSGRAHNSFLLLAGLERTPGTCRLSRFYALYSCRSHCYFVTPTAALLLILVFLRVMASFDINDFLVSASSLTEPAEHDFVVANGGTTHDHAPIKMGRSALALENGFKQAPYGRLTDKDDTLSPWKAHNNKNLMLHAAVQEEHAYGQEQNPKSWPLRGFTPVVEELGPDEMIALLHPGWNAGSAISALPDVFQTQGTICEPTIQHHQCPNGKASNAEEFPVQLGVQAFQINENTPRQMSGEISVPPQLVIPIRKHPHASRKVWPSRRRGAHTTPEDSPHAVSLTQQALVPSNFLKFWPPGLIKMKRLVKNAVEKALQLLSMIAKHVCEG